MWLFFYNSYTESVQDIPFCTTLWRNSNKEINAEMFDEVIEEGISVKFDNIFKKIEEISNKVKDERISFVELKNQILNETDFKYQIENLEDDLNSFQNTVECDDLATLMGDCLGYMASVLQFISSNNAENLFFNNCIELIEKIKEKKKYFNYERKKLIEE